MVFDRHEPACSVEQLPEKDSRPIQSEQSVGSRVFFHIVRLGIKGEDKMALNGVIIAAMVTRD